MGRRDRRRRAASTAAGEQTVAVTVSVEAAGRATAIAQALRLGDGDDESALREFMQLAFYSLILRAGEQITPAEMEGARLTLQLERALRALGKPREDILRTLAQARSNPRVLEVQLDGAARKWTERHPDRPPPWLVVDEHGQVAA